MALLGALMACTGGAGGDKPEGRALLDAVVGECAKATTLKFDFVLAVEEPAGRSDLSGVVALAGHDKSHITIEGTRRGAPFQCTIVRDGRKQRSSSLTHPEALNATLDVGNDADRLNHTLLRNLIREGAFLTIFGVAVPGERYGEDSRESARGDPADVNLWILEYQPSLLKDAAMQLYVERGSLIPRFRKVVGEDFRLTEQYRAFKRNEPLGPWFPDRVHPPEAKGQDKR